MIIGDDTCLYCGVELKRKRSTKKFCTDAHRALYNALPARIETAIEHALMSITTAHDLILDHPEFAEKARPMIETVIGKAREALPRKPYTRQKKADQ